jgi:hypothetical protein
MPLEAKGLVFGTAIACGPVGHGFVVAVSVVPTAAVVRFVAATVAVGGRGVVVVVAGASGVVAGTVVVGVVTEGVVTVTTPEVAPPEPVPPSDGAVLEQNGIPVLGPVVAVDVVFVLETGSPVVFVGVAGAVEGAEPPSPLPPSPGTPAATAITERGPSTANAIALVASSRVNLIRGGCRRIPVPRSGGSGIPRFKRTLEPQATAQVAVRSIVITGGWTRRRRDASRSREAERHCNRRRGQTVRGRGIEFDIAIFDPR